jgi:mono/diheme cytochrome c family protein
MVRRPLPRSGLLRHQTSPVRVLLVASCLAALTLSPAAAQDVSAAAGARIYEKYCSNCHGDDLQNNSNIAFDLRRLKADEHPRFVDSVLHGKKAMPAWQGVLNADQLEALWAYIRANTDR